MIDFKKLAKAGVHFGHQTSRWSPKMAPYIWGHRSGIHLIDISKTAQQLEQAANFLESIAAEGKQILWVGTKKAAQDAIFAAGESVSMPTVIHRWIGGTLTNYSQVKKSITRLLHLEDILDKSVEFSYKKKELNTFNKMAQRLEHSIGGIRKLRWPVGAIVVVDVRKEQTALREAAVMGIPVVALVDTNADPSMVDYVIPGNDDSPKSVRLITDYLAEAVRRGLEKKTADVVEEPTIQEKSLVEVVQEDSSEEKADALANKKKVGLKGPIKKATSKPKMMKRPVSPKTVEDDADNSDEE
ncbi:30S ribosomal protein S2 [Candidatus Babeliales bacterium]|nr:30S ribosomal protein S2 [Candidatus Babeliales bacterium]